MLKLSSALELQRWAAPVDKQAPHSLRLVLLTALPLSSYFVSKQRMMYLGMPYFLVPHRHFVSLTSDSPAPRKHCAQHCKHAKVLPSRSSSENNCPGRVSFFIFSCIFLRSMNSYLCVLMQNALVRENLKQSIAAMRTRIHARRHALSALRARLAIVSQTEQPSVCVPSSPTYHSFFCRLLTSHCSHSNPQTRVAELTSFHSFVAHSFDSQTPCFQARTIANRSLQAEPKSEASINEAADTCQITAPHDSHSRRPARNRIVTC